MSRQERIQYLIGKWNDYCDKSEQHEYLELVLFKTLVIKGYLDLLEIKWDDGLADSLIYALTNYLRQLGMDIDE